MEGTLDRTKLSSDEFQIDQGGNLKVDQARLADLTESAKANYKEPSKKPQFETDG